MARAKSLSHDNVEFFLTHGVDVTNRILMLDEEVTEVTTGLMIRGLKMMEILDPEAPITVYINTLGGNCYDGLALYDALVHSPCEITTIGMGAIMSMGTILILAGDVRAAYPNTSFMWHTVSGGIGGKMFELDTDAAETKRLVNRLLDVYDERSNKRKPFWAKWIKHEDRYGDAELALELGFIHKIIGVE